MSRGAWGTARRFGRPLPGSSRAQNAVSLAPGALKAPPPAFPLLPGCLGRATHHLRGMYRSTISPSSFCSKRGWAG